MKDKKQQSAVSEDEIEAIGDVINIVLLNDEKTAHKLINSQFNVVSKQDAVREEEIKGVLKQHLFIMQDPALVDDIAKDMVKYFHYLNVQGEEKPCFCCVCGDPMDMVTSGFPLCNKHYSPTPEEK